MDVDIERRVGPDRCFNDHHVGVLTEARHRRACDLCRNVILPRRKRQRPRVVVGHEVELDACGFRLHTPVAVVSRELDPVAALEADELERPGADHAFAGVEILGGQPGGRLFLHDVDSRKIVRDERIGRGRLEADRIRVDDLLGNDRLGIDGERSGAVLDFGHPVDGIGYVLGGEVRAVVEFDAAAQLEFPGGVVDRLPGNSQPRFHALLVVFQYQRIEDVFGNIAVRREHVIMRIDGGHVGGQADGEIGGMGTAGERSAKQRKNQGSGHPGPPQKA